MDGLKNRVCFKEGDVIFQQGDPGIEAYYIESGKIEISHKVDCGKQVVDILEAGAIFGEMAFLANQKRLMTARVIETAQCYTISTNFMNKEIENASPFIRALLRVTANTLQRLQT